MQVTVVSSKIWKNSLGFSKGREKHNYDVYRGMRRATGEWTSICHPVVGLPGQEAAEHRTLPQLQEDRGGLGSDNACLLQTTHLPKKPF
jgi:hypothetical protein